MNIYFYCIYGKIYTYIEIYVHIYMAYSKGDYQDHSDNWPDFYILTFLAVYTRCKSIAFHDCLDIFHASEQYLKPVASCYVLKNVLILK